jgi:C4-dicarboxylate-specific signal transduction histidine kinase
MANNVEQILTRQSLAFSGIITASLSHELNNVFAIINEHNGLIDDMLVAAKRGVPLDEKKLQRSSQKITTQLERGKELIKRLNKFAHSSDNVIAEVQLNDLMQEIVALSQRLAGLKEMSLEYKPDPVEAITFNSNPYYLQQAIFTCFQIFMTNPSDNRIVTITADKSDSKVVIKIAGRQLTDDSQIIDRKELLGMLLERLNGKYEIIKEESAIILTLDELKPAE